MIKWERTLCKDCLYCSVSTDKVGKCRSLPPKVILVGHNIRTEYPEVNPSSDWCGCGIRRDSND